MMPPPPTVGSAELIGEMAEVYAQAVLRDEQLANLRFDGSTTDKQASVVDALNAIEWFDNAAPIPGLVTESRGRRRTGARSSRALFHQGDDA